MQQSRSHCICMQEYASLVLDERRSEGPACLHKASLKKLWKHPHVMNELSHAFSAMTYCFHNDIIDIEQAEGCITR